MRTIDLNADLGEGSRGVAPADDSALLALVSSANIACGYHAGDAVLMKSTVAAAVTRGVAIGAHPGYADRENFGRLDTGATPDVIAAAVTDQIRTLDAIARAAGTRVRYVKAHGALYNRAAKDAAAADAIARAIAQTDPSLVMLGLPRTELEFAAHRMRLRFAREGFADRGYQPDGTLIPRGSPGALIVDPDAAAEQAVRLSSHVDSICVHSDTPGAVTLVGAIRAALVARGFAIEPFA